MNFNNELWFHEDCDRDCAMERLRDQPDYTCIVRQRPNKSLVLSYKEEGKIKHPLIYQEANGFRLEKTNQTFETMEDMFYFYGLHPLAEDGSIINIKQPKEKIQKPLKPIRRNFGIEYF